MEYDNQNIFAKILRKEIPCDLFFESIHTVIIKDIAPQAKTHLLVIPKKSYIDLYDFNKNASDNEIVDFWKALNKVIEENNLSDCSFNVKSHRGKNGGQVVFHFHVHLLSDHKPLA